MSALIDRGADKGTAPVAGTAGVAAPQRAKCKGSPAPAPTLKKPAAPRSARAAVNVSLPLLQRADEVFLKTAGCVSCHNNSLFQMTAAVVRSKGFRIDEAIVREQMTRTRAYLESWRERELQDIAIPGRIDTTTYILAGLAAARYPSDPATDALARYVKRRQLAEGGWRVAANRPPIESSDIAVTALALRSLQAYAPAPQKAEYARAIERGAAWLAQARPKSTEDHAFLLLGLRWTGQSDAAMQKAARALVALQGSDGGWSQIPTLGSDAYATGQALTALAESGAVKPNDPVYERGVRFLLGTQLEDGSWYVRSRAIPVSHTSTAIPARPGSIHLRRGDQLGHQRARARRPMTALLPLIEQDQPTRPLNRPDHQSIVADPRRAAHASVSRKVGHFLKRRAAFEIGDRDRACRSALFDHAGETPSVG